MARDRPCVEYLEIVQFEQVLEASHRIVAQVLVIDRVVLQRVEQADEVVRFRDERAIWGQHLDDAIDDCVHVLDVCEAISGGDNARRAIFFLHLTRHLGAEIAFDGGNGARDGDIADVGRLDAEHAAAAVPEARQQRAVIGTNIDN